MWKNIFLCVTAMSGAVVGSQPSLEQLIFNRAIEYAQDSFDVIDALEDVHSHVEKNVDTDGTIRIEGNFKLPEQDIKTVVTVKKEEICVQSTVDDWRRAGFCFPNTPIMSFINFFGACKATEEIERVGSKLNIDINYNGKNWDFFKTSDGKLIGKAQVSECDNLRTQQSFQSPKKLNDSDDEWVDTGFPIGEEVFQQNTQSSWNIGSLIGIFKLCFK